VKAVGPHQILAELAAAVRGGRPVAVATIVTTERSVPRHAGTRMLIYLDGTITGTIGGGSVEATIRDEALATLVDGRPQLRHYRLEDPSQGDPGVCGGTMTVYLEPYMPPNTIFVIGCGHVGRAVVDLAHWLGYHTVAVDDRPELLTEDALPNADVRFPGSVEDAVSAHPIAANTSVVVVTRSYDLDARILPLLLDTPARYIGVMGSRRRWETTRDALAESGLTDDDLGRVHAPIGVEIGAETVEEIAVSILSEVIGSNSADTE
jgi:xanthine dehydrogenase accessory factor